MKIQIDETKRNWIFLIGLVVLTPIFFRIEGGLYREKVLLVDSQGIIGILPLPISIFIVFFSCLLFPISFASIRATVYMLLGIVTAYIVSLWVLGVEMILTGKKFLAVFQMCLPITGLFVGQLIKDDDKLIAKSFLMVLTLVVPLQLISTWLQDIEGLAHYLYIFTIYSHLQYVTVIFVCAYAYALTSLWGTHKILLAALTIIMFLYIGRSYSFLAIVAYVLILFIFFIQKILWNKYRGGKIILYFSLIFLFGIGLYSSNQKSVGMGYVSEKIHQFFNYKFKEIAVGKLPSNVEARLSDWSYYTTGITESKTAIFFGHPQPLSREIRTSPHNWYIEVVYNFGLIGLIPIFVLIGYTVNLCRLQSKTLSPEVWWLAAIVFYLVIIDSNFKVTLRQPYPGIFTYFMWGLLLSRLQWGMVHKTKIGNDVH